MLNALYGENCSNSKNVLHNLHSLYCAAYIDINRTMPMVQGFRQVSLSWTLCETSPQNNFNQLPLISSCHTASV